MNKFNANWIYLITFSLSLLFYSCKNQDKSIVPEAKDNELAKFDTIYNRGGYIVLKLKGTSQKGYGFLTSFASIPIDDDTASRIVRYHINHKGKTLRKFIHPTYVDFSFLNVLKIIDTMESSIIKSERFNSDSAGVRIYFGAYDNKAADMHARKRSSETGVVVPASDYEDRLTTLLIGTYKSMDTTSAFNLGNLCPPNCPNTATSTIDPALSRIYRKALKRSDVQ